MQATAIVTLQFIWLTTAGVLVKGQVSSCDIVQLIKCHDGPGVDVTDRGPYLVG